MTSTYCELSLSTILTFNAYRHKDDWQKHLLSDSVLQQRLKVYTIRKISIPYASFKHVAVITFKCNHVFLISKIVICPHLHVILLQVLEVAIQIILNTYCRLWETHLKFSFVTNQFYLTRRMDYHWLKGRCAHSRQTIWFCFFFLKMPVVLSTIGKRYPVLSDSVEHGGVLEREHSIHHLWSLKYTE